MAKVCRGVKEYNQWGRERKKKMEQKNNQKKKKANKMKKQNPTK